MKYFGKPDKDITVCIRINQRDKDWLTAMGSISKGVRKLLDFHREEALKEYIEFKKSPDYRKPPQYHKPKAA